jgi:hypothetical protein
MELILHRRFLASDYTIGSLYIDRVYFCDALEDKDRGLTQSMPVEEIRRIKISHQTAVPAGVHRVSAAKDEILMTIKYKHN